MPCDNHHPLKSTRPKSGTVSNTTLMPRESPEDTVLRGSDSELKALIFQSPRPEIHDGIVLLSSGKPFPRQGLQARLPRRHDESNRGCTNSRHTNTTTNQLIRSVHCVNVDFLVMERIRGRTIEDAWPGLGWCASLCLAFQLRRFVSSMRSISLENAGSLATGSCRSFWLDDRFGSPARATVRDVMDFLAFWTYFRSIRHEYKKSSHNHVVLNGSRDLSAKAFVLTHHDLAPRNIMVDALGDACLLDWDLAGFYPVYFEYASRLNFKMP